MSIPVMLAIKGKQSYIDQDPDEIELTTEGTQITVTEDGSRFSPLPFYLPPETTHREEDLCCHYEIKVSEKEVYFFLGRTDADQAALIKKAKHHGVTRGVGLWQELGGRDIDNHLLF